jgi:hypothetical protein
MKNYKLEVVPDNSPINPREDDNITTMVCFGKYDYLGDKHDYKSNNFDSLDELKEHIESEYKVLMIKPLYVYDHSGITISTSPFNDRFDTSRIGWVFIDEKKLKTICGEGTYTDKELNEWIDGEVKMYDKYLVGDCYGYEIFEIETCDKGHQHKNLIESCYGYYDEKDCHEDGMYVLVNLRESNCVIS